MTKWAEKYLWIDFDLQHPGNTAIALIPLMVFSSHSFIFVVIHQVKMEKQICRILRRKMERRRRRKRRSRSILTISPSSKPLSISLRWTKCRTRIMEPLLCPACRWAVCLIPRVFTASNSGPQTLNTEVNYWQMCILLFSAESLHEAEEESWGEEEPKASVQQAAHALASLHSQTGSLQRWGWVLLPWHHQCETKMKLIVMEKCIINFLVLIHERSRFLCKLFVRTMSHSIQHFM